MRYLQHRYARLMRLDKPAGYLLVMFPTLWAIAFAAKRYAQMILPAIIFAVGAIIMRSAGCIINDIIDREIDAKVARTQSRPLVSNEVSLQEALLLLAVLLMVAVSLLFFLSTIARYIAIFSIIPITIYPMIKRFNHYPQVFLGFVFNLGVLMAWFTVSEIPSIVALLLYAAAVCWTIGYDTIYAFQDLNDDLEAGIKSMAVKYKMQAAKIVWKMYQFVVIALMLVGLNMQLNLAFYAVMALAWYHLYWQVEGWDITSEEDAGYRFKSNVVFGIIVLGAILLGKYNA